MTSSGEDSRVQNASEMPDDDLVQKKTWRRFPLFLSQQTKRKYINHQCFFTVWCLDAAGCRSSSQNLVEIIWELWSLKVGRNSLLHEIHKVLFVHTF